MKDYHKWLRQASSKTSLRKLKDNHLVHYLSKLIRLPICKAEKITPLTAASQYVCLHGAKQAAERIAKQAQRRGRFGQPVYLTAGKSANYQHGGSK